MSTIFGKCNTGGQPVTQDEAKLMQEAMNHWDADAVHTWLGETAAMGHLMLYNTPESLYERLPLHDNISGLTITADVRIDNRDELYPLLALTTPEDKKLPDSTILLLLYKKYKEQCVQHLVGDFAFAIWDEREQLLFCARDHMGVRPFVYTQQPGFFAFASEKKGLLCLPQLDKAINKQYYYNCLFRQRIQAADTTLYQQIKRLPPAHTLTWSAAREAVTVARYWDLDPDKELILPNVNDYYDGLRAYMVQAVQCRLRSHFPPGAELSGGLDSSVITGIANSILRRSRNEIRTFSAGLSAADEAMEPQIPHEHKYIKAVIRFNDLKQSVFVTQNIWENPLEEVDFFMRANDGLEARSFEFLLPLKHAAMQHGVRALLSGFPGDEMVTYRGQFYFLDYLDSRRYLRYFSSPSELPFNKVKPFVPERISFAMHKIRNILTLTRKDILKACKLLDIPLRELYRMGDVAWQDENYLGRFTNHRHYQKYRFLKFATSMRLESEIRMSIPLKLDTRFPMADIRLAQFYLSLPNAIKSEGTFKRTAYRKAMAQYLPEEVLQRDNKYGNMAPYKSVANSRIRAEAAAEAIVQRLKKSNTAKNYDLLLKLKAAHRPNIRITIDMLRWLEFDQAVAADR